MTENKELEELKALILRDLERCDELLIPPDKL
jgi:hypothetical protein